MTAGSTTFSKDLTSAIERLAEELQTAKANVEAVVQLLQDGNTLPFIARYRKEATGGLDEVALRTIEDEVARAEELAARRESILKSLQQQEVLTAELKRQLEQCTDKASLEDLYAPFKQKRRTRAQAAREKGLQPLADVLLQQRRLAKPGGQLLNDYVNAEKGVADSQEALAGACDIVAETWAQDGELRQWMQQRAARGTMRCKVKRGKKADGEKYEAFFDQAERIDRMPSHRFLAMKRGEAEGILKLQVELDDEYVMPRLQRRLIANPNFDFADALKTTVDDCYHRLLQPAAESFQLQQLKQKADLEAITVFARNLRELLLAAPAGKQVTMGIDPGFRTGCKVAIVDETGRFLQNATIFPTAPRNDVQSAGKTVFELIQKHGVQLIAIGNGTASRETEEFVRTLIRDRDLQVTPVMVSEAGASVYSASELAGKEYPDLDVTVRGAISIAHRLQDPLAALVKIDARSIGVGQYQHDVNQSELKKALDREVMSCVNNVGVDLNSASTALLTHVAGIGPTLAQAIVKYRDQHGAFASRAQLKKVPRLGEKAFGQAAGFLRVPESRQPLDNSSVHPESYSVVTSICQRLKTDVPQLLQNEELLRSLKPTEFKDLVGELTFKDIVDELRSPGRDPRSEFKTAEFDKNIQSMEDLLPEMKLEGVVTNVTHFGAFVDIGVHQDGLIHVSQLADHFVSDPTQEIRVGEIVSVRVLEVDVGRKRISLSRKKRD